MRTQKFVLLTLLTGISVLSACKKNDEIMDRNKFLGTYAISETCSGSPDEYELTVSKGFLDNEIVLKNLYFQGIEADAKVSGNSITIPSQDFSGRYNGEPVTVTVSGSGTFSDNKLTINFTGTISGVGGDQCTAIGTKK